jgi:hypothetical protein
MMPGFSLKLPNVVIMEMDETGHFARFQWTCGCVTVWAGSNRWVYRIRCKEHR